MLAVFVLGCQAAGWIGIPFTDRATGGWYDGLEKPAFNPPSWVFGPVWTVLYLLIGVAGWRIWRSDAGEVRRTALTWFALQLVLNAIWTPLFFGAEAILAAAIELAVLWIAVVMTTVWFRRVDGVAAWLMLPYLLWVSFALVLNASIVILES